MDDTNIAQALGTALVDGDWGQRVLNYVDIKVGYGEQNRDNFFETLNNIHWAVRQVLRFNLDEAIVEHLLRRLDYMGGYLSWQFPVASMIKTAMHDERMDLRTRLKQHLFRHSTEGTLREAQKFVRFDSDGSFLSIAQTNVLQSSFVSADGVALLCDMFLRELLSEDFFVSRLKSENPRCLFKLKDEVLIACGDAPLAVCCAPSDIADLAGQKFSIAWCVDVNFPPDQLGDHAYMVARIPYFVRALLQQEKARLFLSASGEMSLFRHVWYEQVAGLAQHLGCKLESIVYLPQNVGFAHDYAAFVAAGGATAGVPRVIPLNTHLLLPTMQQAARIGDNPSKKFLCFNNRPHIHRAALFLGMHREGMLADSHMSFNGTLRNLPSYLPQFDAQILAPWMALPQEEVDALIDAVDPALPLRLDLDDKTAGPSSLGAFIWTFDAGLHEDAAIYLVAESEMGGASSRRFTEKTVKGLAAMSPFIVFGNPGTLASLREWGFQTFAPFIDEAYDDIEDPIARFHAAYAEVRRLHAMPMAQLLEQRRSLYPVLEHNRQRLLRVGEAFSGILQKGFDTVYSNLTEPDIERVPA